MEVKEQYAGKRFAKKTILDFREFFYWKIFDFFIRFFAFFRLLGQRYILDFHLSYKFEFLTFLSYQKNNEICATS